MTRLERAWGAVCTGTACMRAPGVQPAHRALAPL